MTTTIQHETLDYQTRMNALKAQLFQAAIDGDLREVANVFHLAVDTAYAVGVQDGMEDEQASWGRDLDIIDESLNETLAD